MTLHLAEAVTFSLPDLFSWESKRDRSGFTSTTQNFYGVWRNYFMSTEMDCIITNVTVHTWWQKHIVVVKCEWTLRLRLNKVGQLNRISLALLWSLLKVYRCLGYSEHVGPRPWYSVSLWWTMCLPPAHVTNTQNTNTLNKTQQKTTLGSFSF